MTESAATNASIVMELPSITLALRTKRKGTIAQEKNTARLPFFASPKVAITSNLYQDECKQVRGGPLPPAGQRAMAYLATLFIANGCPSNREVQFSLSDITLAVGYQYNGGSANEKIRQLLIDLRSATFETKVRSGGGQAIKLRNWGLLESVETDLKGYRKCRVTLSTDTAQLILDNSVIWLSSEILHKISNRDELAALLWMFLEGESLKQEFSYRIFKSDDLTARASIADLLNVNHWQHKKNAIQRIREACIAVMEHDPRYLMRVDSSKTMKGQWLLWVHRTDTPSKRQIPTGGVPDEVIRAWKWVYGYHKPSQRQLRVLGEICTRWTTTEVSDILSEPGTEDPLQRLMRVDRERTTQRLANERGREVQWDTLKAAEQRAAKVSLPHSNKSQHMATSVPTAAPNMWQPGSQHVATPVPTCGNPGPWSSSKQGVPVVGPVVGPVETSASRVSPNRFIPPTKRSQL